MPSLKGRIFLRPENDLVPAEITWEDGGRIERIEPKLAGKTGPVVLPGFIDEHIHGIAGMDVMDEDLGRFAKISAALAHHGVTGFVATTITAPIDPDLRRVIEQSQMAAQDGLPGASLLGIHLEGPFIDPTFKGAQPESAIIAPSIERARELIGDNRDGWVRLITMAPNMPGAIDVMPWMISHRVAVNLGHSAATWDIGRAGLVAGATGLTHFFNAMSPLKHREPGLVGLGLMNSQLWCELITDGIHVRPEVVRYVFQTMGHRVLLITDAMAAAAMPDGDYRLGGFPVRVLAGAARLADGTLAGSVLTLDQALRNLLHWGVPLSAIVAAISENPATRLGLANRGRLAPAMQADMVLLDDDWQVHATLRDGVAIYDAH
ncbi:MAG: N-acetylglucosamine-6-phosphate deacetylase [Sulfobacillus benefaciens]|uniref:N-acetylglucosamine-6-phosphate deacetylase n=1 Tax=Sulfobacillus benefaciens TaxID=453960 RepID=A0A2T2XJJ4_9FIRM|nr:MAG: N-acetylglucosamine-6-phosphate deacetylase [Sulfobacillus benefaciens]